MTASERTLHELAACCLGVGLPGSRLDEASVRVLDALRPRTVILFARNTPNLAVTRQLCHDLQGWAAGRGSGPLLVCADQEGGRVQRLRRGVHELPAAWLLGQAGPDHVREVSEVAARDLLAAGINLVLAPVADVNVEPENPVIGTRAFGADPSLVGACVAAAVEGFRKGGALSCAKHFPGHGDTRVDSHLGLPVLERTEVQLEGVELPPFRTAIAAGVDSIMVGHLAVPDLDPSGRPASLSAPITTGLLRERLGWSGPILTDDLEMSGVEGPGGGPGPVAVGAMAAGSDLLFFSHTPRKAQAARDALVEAVRGGRLPEVRLREAAARVDALAQRAVARGGGDRARNGAAVIEAAVAAGVRVVRRLAPGARDAPDVLSLVDGTLTRAESIEARDPFAAAARDRGLAVVGNLATAEAAAGPLVVGVRRPDAETLARLDALSRRRPTTVVALAEPWLLERVPAAAAIAAGDGGRLACERALTLALR